MTDAPFITIAGRRIGPGERPYVIAEMSGNHNGDIGRAIAILDAARSAGADAVKLQTYRADTITLDHDGPEFIVRGGSIWDGRRLYDLYEEAHLPWDWHAPLFAHAARIGITLFSSPFDPTAVDFLESLGAPAYKIASPELVDLGLIECCARTGKPLIISTGMASEAEIAEALAAARGAGAREIVVLHCTSAYPTPAAEANLATIPDIARRFGVQAGLSDHTMGTTAAAIAVALGATVIEKHFTLSRADGGVDSSFSLEPAELVQLVASVAFAHQAVGAPAYLPTQSEATGVMNRRSLYVVAPVARGEVFTPTNVRSIRPANGMAPRHLPAILGRRAACDIAYGTALAPALIEGWTDGPATDGPQG